MRWFILLLLLAACSVPDDTPVTSCEVDDDCLLIIYIEDKACEPCGHCESANIDDPRVIAASGDPDCYVPSLKDRLFGRICPMCMSEIFNESGQREQRLRLDRAICVDNKCLHTVLL